MSAPVTIVVVPRERFSAAPRALETLYENTPGPFELIYVDPGSPPTIRDYLRQQAGRRNFRLIRFEKYLSPNQARNAALGQVQTPYTVLMDNDVLVHPGWLSSLLGCAEETGAAVVGPLYLMATADGLVVHMAGGRMRIIGKDGARRLDEEDGWPGANPADLDGILIRGQTDLVEFHTLLVQTPVFSRIGLLDERLQGIRDHEDLCLSVRAAGGSIYQEPSARVTFLPPPPVTFADLPFFAFRWNRSRMEDSLRYFHEKWRLEMSLDDPKYAWVWRRRQLFIRQYVRRLRNMGGKLLAGRN